MSDYAYFNDTSFLLNATDKISFYENHVLLTPTVISNSNNNNSDTVLTNTANNMIDNNTIVLNNIYQNVNYDDVNIILNDITPSNHRKRKNEDALPGSIKVRKLDTDAEPCRICGETKTTGKLALIFESF
jgi:hypothetical protein